MRCLLVLILATGCIVPAPGASDGGVARAPMPPVALGGGAVFGESIELVKGVATPGRATPGDAVQISLTFRLLKPVEDDYLIFVHVEDADGKVERRNADHPPLRGNRPTPSWRQGELLTDDFSVDIPPGIERRVNLWIGFWQPARDVRLPITNPAVVRHDGQDRLLLAQLPVGR